MDLAGAGNHLLAQDHHGVREHQVGGWVSTWEHRPPLAQHARADLAPSLLAGEVGYFIAISQKNFRSSGA